MNHSIFTNPNVRDEVDADICAVIMACHNEEEAVSAAEIARRIRRLSPRRIRERISRIFGDALASGPFLLGTKSGGGFWRVTDFDSAVATHAWLKTLQERAGARVKAYEAACRREGLAIGAKAKGAPLDGKAILKAAIAKQAAMAAEKRGKHIPCSDAVFARAAGISRTAWIAMKKGTYKSDPIRNLTKLAAFLAANP